MDDPTPRRASRAGSCLRSSVGGKNSTHDDGGISAPRLEPGTASRSAAVNLTKTATDPMRTRTMLPAYPARTNDVRARRTANVAVSA